MIKWKAFSQLKKGCNLYKICTVRVNHVICIDRDTESFKRKKRDFSNNELDEECTFKPQIDPISNLIAQNSPTRISLIEEGIRNPAL